jgi:hypothetical protein
MRKEEMQKFLEEDNIDFLKLSANLEIIKNGNKEIYKANAKLQGINDISENATKTVEWVAPILNQPLGYPQWFMAAYPDVVKWFAESLEDNEIIDIIGEPTEDFFDENNNLNFSILRKIVNAYKLVNTLECI